MTRRWRPWCGVACTAACVLAAATAPPERRLLLARSYMALALALISEVAVWRPSPPTAHPAWTCADKAFVMLNGVTWCLVKVLAGVAFAALFVRPVW